MYYETQLSTVLFSCKSECLAKEGKTTSVWEAQGVFCAACRSAWKGHCSRTIQQLLLTPLTGEWW